MIEDETVGKTFARIYVYIEAVVGRQVPFEIYSGRIEVHHGEGRVVKVLWPSSTVKKRKIPWRGIVS